MVEIINNEICELVEWLHMNKLFLNIEKTQYMIFSLRKKIKPEKDIYIYKIKLFNKLNILNFWEIFKTKHFTYIVLLFYLSIHHLLFGGMGQC